MEIKVEFDDAVVKNWALDARKIKEAVALIMYQKGEVTMGAAANIIGCDKDEFDRLMRESGVHFNYGEEDLNEDLQTLDKLANEGKL